MKCLLLKIYNVLPDLAMVFVNNIFSSCCKKEACPNNAYRGHINFHNFSSLTNISMLPWANKVKRLYFPITSRAQYSPGIASVLKLFSPKRNNYYWFPPLFRGFASCIRKQHLLFDINICKLNKWKLNPQPWRTYTSSWAIFSLRNSNIITKYT